MKRPARNVVFLEFLVPLVCLHAQEHEAEDQREDDENDQSLALPELR